MQGSRIKGRRVDDATLLFWGLRLENTDRSDVG